MSTAEPIQLPAGSAIGFRPPGNSRKPSLLYRRASLAA